MLDKINSNHFIQNDFRNMHRNGTAAAEEFEALLVAQILRAARESEAADSSGAPLLEMAEDRLARVIAAQGGLGVGRLIREHLAARESGTKDSHNREVDR